MITDPFFYVVAVPAVILYGLSKGGFGGVAILSMPLLSLAISPIEAAAIMLPVLMVQDVVTVWSYRRTWDRATLTHLVPGALVGILTGYLFASDVSEPAVRLIVGVIAVAFCLDRWLRPPPVAGDHRPQDWTQGTIVGALSGYTSFVLHVGGPPFNMYAMPRGLPRDVFVGTAAVFFAGVNLVKVTPFLALGALSPGNLATAAVLFPLAIVANMGGIWLVRRVPAAAFYRIVYALTFMVGCVLLVGGIRSFL
jgi:uncharacterized membrane protein YfcA